MNKKLLSQIKNFGLGNQWINVMNRCPFTEQISKSETCTSSFLLSIIAHSFPEGFKHLYQLKGGLSLRK